MNILDIGFIIIVLFGAIIGFKRGLTKSLVSAVGFVAVIILAFIFKNPLSVILYENLPFFSFGGFIKGVTVLNIVLYEMIAFLIIVAVLTIVLKVLLLATSIFEKLLTATIILGIPSKLLGAVVGLVQYFIIAFLALYVVSLPVFNIDIVNESKIRNKVLNNTPILSNVADKGISVFNEFGTLKDKYKNESNANEFNLEALDLLLKYDVVKVDSIDKLVKKDKLKINNIDTVLNKYRNEE